MHLSRGILPLTWTNEYLNQSSLGFMVWMQFKQTCLQGQYTFWLYFRSVQFSSKAFRSVPRFSTKSCTLRSKCRNWFESVSTYGHELLSFLFRYAHKNLSTLESYRFCPLIGSFLRKLEKPSMSLAKWVPSHFSPASTVFISLRKWKHVCGSQKRTPAMQIAG